MGREERAALYLRYAAQSRDRFTGRAADTLAPLLELKPLSQLADKPCRESILRCRHVHVDPDGRIMPGTCAGLVLGRCGERTPGDVWRELDAGLESRPVVGALAAGGPMALLAEAVSAGMTPREGYAGKCHLCWDVRRFLARRGLHGEELGPRWMYEDGPG